MTSKSTSKKISNAAVIAAALAIGALQGKLFADSAVAASTTGLSQLPSVSTNANQAVAGSVASTVSAPLAGVALPTVSTTHATTGGSGSRNGGTTGSLSYSGGDEGESED